MAACLAAFEMTLAFGLATGLEAGAGFDAGAGLVAPGSGDTGVGVART